MARDPGEWYAEKAAEAARLEGELADARAVLETYRAGLEAAREVVRRLERRLEQARYVGD
jgi:hypothetical protein